MKNASPNDPSATALAAPLAASSLRHQYHTYTLDRHDPHTYITTLPEPPLYIDGQSSPNGGAGDNMGQR
ncbi:hypothetical protein OUZ56_012252 [Daphnia magna]|uniref:Uncharacterized protein n=1 Tax=Daphnia magna TaxID=35525 RepID=A0ABQ9Z2H4_9CRUS|nr:hypothetical protein OUZ56_012252 [Daphnia magna]